MKEAPDKDNAVPRRAGLLLLIVLLVIVAGLAYFAHVARVGLTRGLSTWAEQQRRQGWIVAATQAPPPASIFAPEIGLRDITIAGGREWFRDGFALSADSADLRVDLINPTVLHVTVKGNVSLRFGDTQPISFANDSLVITVSMKTEKFGAFASLASIAIDGKNLRSLGADGSSIGTLDGTLALTDDGADLDLRSEAVVIPIDPLGLGRHLSDVTLNATLHGWPPAIGTRAERADIWRQSGGSVEITRLVAGWGPLGVVGQAKVGLDASLQPDGTGTLQVRGYQSALANLGGAGVLIAALYPGDSAAFDLRMKKDKITANRMTLMKLPRVEW